MSYPLALVGRNFAALLATLLAAGAADASRDHADAAARYQAPTWRLIWGDEFDKAGAPDPAKWGYETGRVRNREAQFYTTDRRENARIENGHLVITARREPWQGAGYTSASVVSEGKFSFCYGKLEIRAKIPAGRGTWPALWLLGDSHRRLGWPRCGEIDLMENVGFDPDKLHFTVHTEAFNHLKKTEKGRAVTVPHAHEEFQVYGLLWTKQRIEFFLDGKKVHEFANDGQGVEHWPFDQPFYLLMNLAIGGDWGGQKGIDDAIFPLDYRIDYVRVWQQ
ncbi:MAG: glycoside hydrolase family 16 protein [Verrucomicrobia bacterium]|nr:glycoside hydrolase family 16 protein [Verrucomicrobiota bacterium]